MGGKRCSPEQLAKLAAKEAEWRQIMGDWKAGGIDGRSYAAHYHHLLIILPHALYRYCADW